VNQRSLPSEIGFSDGEVVSYRREGDELAVVVKAWNERKIALIFKSVASFSDYGAGDISDVVEVDGSSSYMDQALKRIYEAPPANHEYHHYQFLDVSGAPVIEIVATSAKLI